MRGDEVPVAPGYPAPPEIASQITTQYIIANLVARITAKGQSIKKGIRWAENELEGISLGLDAIIEVHNEKEINDAIKFNSNLIGINNRNLKDFNWFGRSYGR